MPTKIFSPRDRKSVSSCSRSASRIFCRITCLNVWAEIDVLKQKAAAEEQATINALEALNTPGVFVGKLRIDDYGVWKVGVRAHGKASELVTARGGAALVAAGSTSRGLSQLQLAARLGESDPQLFVDLGDAEQLLGRTADAHAAYRMALDIDPYYRPARARLAGIGVPPSG